MRIRFRPWGPGLRSRTRSLSVAALLAAVVCFGYASPSLSVDLLRVEQGKSIVLKYPEKIETVSLANDSIADVTAITADQLVVIGKRTGTTTLVVWGASQQYKMYDIKVIRSFAGQQIMLEVQIGEVNRNALNELGFDFLWNNTGLSEGEIRAGSFAGEVQPPGADKIPDPLSLGEGVTGMFRFIGDENDVAAVVHALQSNGSLKMLATPKLLTVSGAKASFLSGGEIPVPVATSSTGGAQSITVQWKEYGIRLNFMPVVIDSDLINLMVEPEVSSIDRANGVSIGGFFIPALITRRANSTVELHSGEAMFLGGLVAAEKVDSRQRVPILGHIPLLGALFTRTTATESENELVIIVSPRIVGPAKKEPIPPLPWDGSDDDDKGQSGVDDSTNQSAQPGQERKWP